MLDQSQQLLLNEQKKSQLLLEIKNDEPAEWQKEKSRLENSVSRYQNSYNQANQRAETNYNSAVYATRLFLDCYGNSWGTFDVIAYLGMDTLSLRIGKMTFRGQLFVGQ